MGVLAPDAAARARFSWEEMEVIQKKWPEAKSTSTGLRYVVLREGQGNPPRSGDIVKVLYTGMLFDGTVFDKALDPQNPFARRIGRGELIGGWEEGIALMQKGEKRILIVPFELGYGSRGQPPRIPRQTSLVFEVELIDIVPFTAPTGDARPKSEK